MESAAKRKASNAATGDNDGRPAKRQKVPAEPDANAETVETTTVAGLKFLASLKAAKDKTGRPIADHFLTLPDPETSARYYEHIKLPIALDTIEDKLNAGKYSTLAQVESDCKRLVNNAKMYNEKKSAVYEDAERLRKTASNWMTKNNPAYRDGTYIAQATPIPGEESGTPSRPTPRVAATPRPVPTPTASSETAERPRRAAAAAAAQMATPMPSRLRQTASAATPSRGSTNFAGKSFQQAQEQIISDIIGHTEDEFKIFEPFVHLPPRSMKDYYALIKNPVSLSQVQKRVRGVQGREAPTGETLLKSWDEFEHAMSVIWTNARIYNEDGSEIYELSQELENLFYEKLNNAKAHINEPPQPKLKLNMSGGATPAPKQQLKLKLRQSPGSDSATPGARSSTTPGIIVDSDALQRQQRHVLDATNRSSRPSSSGKTGTPSAAANPFTGPRGSSASITPFTSGRTRVGATPTVNGLQQDMQSPAFAAGHNSSMDSHRLSAPTQTPSAIMAPPTATPRLPSGSPHPNGISGLNTSHQASINSFPQSPRVDCLRKKPLNSINEALIPKIKLNTHPALNHATPWSVYIQTSKVKSHHSATLMISPTHSYIQITPIVPIAFTDRLYRLYITVNNTRTMEVNRVPVTAGINGGGEAEGYESGKKKGEPVYEAKLMAGVNRIEVEIVAEPRNKSSTADFKEGEDGLDREKCTIFLHLRRIATY